MGRPSQRMAPRAIGAFVPKLTRTAFEKFGFSTAALITDWPQIVGASLAKTTSPDKIRWPRAPGAQGGAGEERAPSGPRSGATLHLSVEPALALDVQYKTALIIDRINAYFGYRAVADLRIVQKSGVSPVDARGAGPRVSAAVVPEPAVAAIADNGLRAALERMQSGLVTRSR
jgi:hypothetical protein